MCRKWILAFVVLLVVLGSVSLALAQESQGQATVLGRLNFRAEPSVKASKIQVLGHGETYPVFAKTVSGYWYQLGVDGVIGWVCRSFVQLDFDPALLPVASGVVDQDCEGHTLTYDPAVNPPEAPQVTITDVPRYGAWGVSIKGRVDGLDPSQYKVAVFIFVPYRGRQGWWTKPYWAWPDTWLSSGGYFSCRVTTGGVDHLATKYMVFVVPIDYEIPLAYGGSIPAAIYNVAVLSASVDRPPQ